MSVRFGLLVLIPLAAIGCGEGERTNGGADDEALMQEIATGDDSWQAIVDAAKAEGEVHVRSVFPESVEADLFRRFEGVLVSPEGAEGSHLAKPQ